MRKHIIRSLLGMFTIVSCTLDSISGQIANVDNPCPSDYGLPRIGITALRHCDYDSTAGNMALQMKGPSKPYGVTFEMRSNNYWLFGDLDGKCCRVRSRVTGSPPYTIVERLFNDERCCSSGSCSALGISNCSF